MYKLINSELELKIPLCTSNNRNLFAMFAELFHIFNLEI